MCISILLWVSLEALCGSRNLRLCPLPIIPLCFASPALKKRKKQTNTPEPTGGPSSKYEHWRASALLRNIRNIRICMWKKPTVSVTYENERTSIKNSLPCIKCVLHLSCVVHEPIYGRFRGCTVNGFLSLPEGTGAPNEDIVQNHLT